MKIGLSKFSFIHKVNTNIMRTYILFAAILACISANRVFAQRGLYKCIHFEFKNENDPSKNLLKTEEQILTIDFDAVSNKYVMLRVKNEETGEDFFYKWNIKYKVDANYDNTKNIVQTTYSSKFEVLGIEIDKVIYIYKIDDINDKSLNIIVYDPEYKTRTYFLKLQKF